MLSSHTHPNPITRPFGRLFCSPELLHVRCRSAEQMRLVNALCVLV